MALLLAAIAVHAQPPADGSPKITLKTDPSQMRAGQEFEMIWRVSAENAQILQVFVDCADSFGPEHTWKHDGDGAFESRVKHVEKTPGPKEYELWAKVRKGGECRFAGESFQINVAQRDGDQDLAAFLSWLKEAGYSDEIIQIHAYDGTKPVVRQQWDKYFAMRKGNLEYRALKTMPIVFVDLLATEDEATNEPLEGQTDKLKEYMTRIYGKTFDIHYLQERVSYQSLFGKPALQKNAKGDQWLKFDSGAQGKYARETAARITKERELPSNAVMFHWAAKKWKHEGDDLQIQDFTGSSPANSGMDFGGFGLGTYAHEWGHGLGLGHMFVDGPGSFASRIWGLECIMNHTYVGYANQKVGRLLSPLGRYVLEPKDGFLDQKTFVATYSEAMAGTELLNRRLQETRTGATVASTMTWTTPWSTNSQDSVIRTGLRNRSYEVQQLELHPGIKPGTYSLVVETDGGSKLQKKLILKQDGRVVASTSFPWQTKVSQTTPHKITIENFLSLAIGSFRGGNLAGIGELINEKPFVVPEKR
jgi:hypothetical protein